MSASFGINFGCTTASLAVFKNGSAHVVANEAGDRVTPAVVGFTDHDQSVGLPAKQGQIRNANNTVCQVKKVLGLPFTHDAVQLATKTSSAKVVEEAGKCTYQVQYKGKTTKFRPETIITLIFKTLLDIAESHGDKSDTHDVVLTAPLSFTDDQKEALRLGASKAGFHVVRVISEPASAALAYDIGQADPNEPCTVLVYRAGGQSLDVTIIRVVSGMYQVLGHVTKDDTGGSCLTQQLTNYLATEFKRQWKTDLTENKRAMNKLTNAAENCKHILSSMTTAQCSLESLHEGIDFQNTVSRGRFEGLASTVLSVFIQPIDQVLQATSLQKEDIQKVILCGGTAKVPCLQNQIKSYFSDAEVLCSLPPEEVIALGAAKQAGVISGQDMVELEMNERETEVPCLPHDILIQSGSKEEPVYIPVLTEFTPIPVRRQRTFTLGDTQTSFSLHILASTADKTAPVSLAKIIMKDLPKGASITASFHVKSDGGLHVSCTEVTTNEMKDVTINHSQANGDASS